MSTPNAAYSDTPTREAWLEKAIRVYMRPTFAQLGHRLPDVIHVSPGFAYGKSTGESKHIPGETWSGMHSPDGNPHIFISPFVSDPVEVLCVLVHECIHALLDPDMTHGDEQGEPFRGIATSLGLVGHLDATTGDAALKAQFAEMVGEPYPDPDGDGMIGGELGPYPHPALELLPSLAVNDPKVVVTSGKVKKTRPRTTSGQPKQENRHVRAICGKHPDAPVVRTAISTIKDGRGPLCGEPVMVFPEDGNGEPTVKPCGERMTAKIEQVADGGDAPNAAEAS
jgi:hypothetical protein